MALNAIVIYSDSKCGGTPVRVFMQATDSCAATACEAGEYNGGVQYRTSECLDEKDRHRYIADVFNGVSYVILDAFNDDGCSSLNFTSAYLAAGTCQSGISNATAITKLYSNGSAFIQAYNGLSCGGDPSLSFFLDENTITSHTCYEDQFQFYSSASEQAAGTASSASVDSAASTTIDGSSATSDSSSAISTSAIVGIIVGCVVLVLLFIVGVVIVWRRAKAAQVEDELSTPTGWTPDGKSTHQTLEATTANGQSGSYPTYRSQPSGDMSGTITGMWNDEAIVAARVPREKVIVKERLSRGGYGEVFTGSFNDQIVAVKRLLPETRKSIAHVNEFLSEVKMMAMMEHPRITKFIGVAWDSLSDLCVVSELMVGGDLRALLNKFEEENYPKGFDVDKVQIAVHVAHALAYMHSLDPAVIHRDLKSKNILLNERLDAKLTDFGISRERVDQTMTAGIGTSLWMAPEVMLGERYDDKADMFSFGVVLSELDSHALPYSHAKDSSNSSRKMPDAVILQQVTMGRLSVKFTELSCQSMSDLGAACTSIDPNDRPTSAQALGKLHHILTHEMGAKERISEER